MKEEAIQPYSRDGRVWYLDWLRVAACLAVVLIHSFTTLLDNSTVSEVGVARALVWTEILVVFGRWAVPVFLMVTGALLLDPLREVGREKLRGYVMRVMAVLLTFGVAYALLELIFNLRSFEVSMVFIAALNVFQGRGWAHFWYLYDLMGVYLILPLIRSFSSTASRRDYEAMLAVLFACSLVIPSVNAALGLELETLIWFGSSIFYVLLGRYLSIYELPMGPVLGLGIISAAVQMLLACGGIVLYGDYCSWVWNPSSPFVAFWAAAVFLTFKRFLDLPMKRDGVARVVASCSFAVYVVHPLFANFLYKAMGWASAPLPPVLFELTTYFLIMLPSFVLSLVLRKMPVVRRIL